MQTSAKEVLSSVASNLKARGLTQEQIAHDLGYNSRNAVGKIFNAGKYMTRSQAKKFSATYGFYEDYLVSGAGSLTGPTEEPHTTYYIPKYALLLRPFESKEQFHEAFDVFMRAMVATYGARDIQRFLQSTIRYISVLQDPERDWALSHGVFDERGNMVGYEDTSSAFHNMPDDMDKIRDQIKKIQEIIIQDLYDSYSIMVQK